jgi:hypothetical protein
VFNNEILRSPRMNLNRRSFRRRRTIGFPKYLGGSVFENINWRLHDEEIVKVLKLWEEVVDNQQFRSFGNV